MATVPPLISDIHVASAGEHVESVMLEQLAVVLPDSYELFHRVDWTRAEPHRESHAELDIPVVNSAGDIAVLEVKASKLDATGGGLFKHYGPKRKDVARQGSWQFRSILGRLKAEGLDARLMLCLVLTYFRLGSEGTIDYPRERIADADDCPYFAGFVQCRLGAGQPDARQERVHAFLLDRMHVQRDISALAGALERRISAISGGLARWVRYSPRTCWRTGL